jgi:hypothetical protein
MKIYNSIGTEILDVNEDSESRQHKGLMDENIFTMKFSLPECVDIPMGAYIDFEGERYYLANPAHLKRHGARNLEYTIIFDSNEYHLKKYKIRDAVRKRLKFSITAKPIVILQLIVDILNTKDSGWTVGTCIDASAQTLNFNHTYLYNALKQTAETFKTEYEINIKEISLRKVEYNKDNPLALSYGKGNGFKPGTGRSNYSDTKPVEVLLVEGGERNIDYSKYGSQQLLLPKSQSIQFDGTYFEDEEGFNSANARTYITDADGESLKRGDIPLSTGQEDSLDCTHIYPSRVGTVSGVEVIDEEDNLYDVIDSSIPESLDYSLYRIAGEKAVIKFETGILAGREFDLEQTDAALTGYVHSERRFKIVPQEIDGQTMPNSTFTPAIGDQYAIFGIQLPDAYICDNDTKSGASWDMFREAVRHKYDNEDPRFSFTGELDSIWSKQDWLNIGGKIKLGGYTSFTDIGYQTTPVLIRITDVIKYSKNPQAPKIELSNVTVGGGVMSDIKKPDQQEVVIDDKYKDSIRFTKRSFRDAQETIDMLAASMLDFSGQINPIAIQTMLILLGDKSLQYRFVNSTDYPVTVEHAFTYDKDTKKFSTPAGIIQHMTLGITSLSSSHVVSEYRFWNVTAYESPALTDPAKKYYLYIWAGGSSSSALFVLSETALPFNDGYGNYYFLTGTLNSEYEGDRSFAAMYGYSEIGPGRMIIDKIISPDGNTYINLSTGVIQGVMRFLAGSTGLSSVTEFSNLSNAVSGLSSTVSGLSNTVSGLSSTVSYLDAYIDGAFHDGVISEAEAIAINRYLDELATSWTKITTEYGKLYDNPSLSSAQKSALGNAYIALTTAYNELVSTINTIIADGEVTEAEITTYDNKITAYCSALGSYTSVVEDARNNILSQYEYLKQAIEGSTDIIGGLILTRLLMLKNAQDEITAGVSGLDTNNLFLFANDTDALNAALNNMATFLMRRDGTGNLGNLKFTKTGLAYCTRNADGTLGKAIIEFRSTPIPPLSDLVASFSTTVNDTGGDASKIGGILDSNFGYGNPVTVSAYDNFTLRVQGSLTVELYNDDDTPASASYAEIRLVLYKYENSTYTVQQYVASLSRQSDDPGEVHGSLSVDETMTLQKGTYYLRAEYYINTVEGSLDGGSVSASSLVMTASGASANACMIFGSDGFVRVKDATNYDYLSDTFLAHKGAFDLPGLLAAGSVSSTRIQTNIIGAKASGLDVTRQSAGLYRIPHSIGHSNYTISLIPLSSNFSFRPTSKQNTYVEVEFKTGGTATDTAFDYQIYGTN